MPNCSLQILQMLAGGRLADPVQRSALADTPGLRYIFEKLESFKVHRYIHIIGLLITMSMTISVALIVEPLLYSSMDGLPVEQGLYDPRNEHDACGIGFVVNIKGEQSHDIILKGLQILINLAHRGACGCDPETGDGAGILIQIPHKFFARECAELGFTLPPRGRVRRRAWCSCRWSRRIACWPKEFWSASPAKKA